MENKELKRKYLTITEVQNEYLPVSKKKIRSLAKRYLSVKMIGGRMFISREELEELLTDDDNAILPLS
ncbi:MAG: helix-turn-helix domain-containing protein [Ruminococcaceae bacterium]|nr:helix-turn-helix domain-containing protein [Oscillospiraceae bacterium]